MSHFVIYFGAAFDLHENEENWYLVGLSCLRCSVFFPQGAHVLPARGARQGLLAAYDHIVKIMQMKPVEQPFCASGRSRRWVFKWVEASSGPERGLLEGNLPTCQQIGQLRSGSAPNGMTSVRKGFCILFNFPRKGLGQAKETSRRFLFPMEMR